jgi:hypothetical protein
MVLKPFHDLAIFMKNWSLASGGGMGGVNLIDFCIGLLQHNAAEAE